VSCRDKAFYGQASVNSLHANGHNFQENEGKRYVLSTIKLLPSHSTSYNMCIMCIFVSYVYLLYCVFITVFFCILDAGLLARSQYSEGPATGILDTSFSWFLCVYKQMLRWFPRFQVATTCFSCSPPDLNLVVTNFMFCLHVK